MKLHVTCGDPLGIGPEIVLKAFGSIEAPKPHIYGHLSVLKEVADHYGISLPEMELIQPREKIDPLKDPGKAQFTYLKDAVNAVMKDPSQAVLVTAPICKTAACTGGLSFPGHTEFLAHESKTHSFGMMMAGPKLRVILATTHLPLSQVPLAINKKNLSEKIILAHESLRKDFSITTPRLAVAGLNPHAGEDGAFGDEEIITIQPAIQNARELLENKGEQTAISGPHAPDTVFWQAVNGKYDAVLSMYHDQGLVASKVLDLHETVNVTLGLPFVRTSPDHGVAYDLAKKGEALPNSFRAAVKMGIEIWNRRSQSKSP